jgi:chloramphenicol 3-O phosphotransferase
VGFSHDGPIRPEEPSPGRIILLNGTSSSGKSSIAEELARILDDPHYFLAVDAFNAMRDRRNLDGYGVDDILYRMRRGFHRAIAGMAAGGNDLVVDHIMSEQWRLRDCLELFTPFDVVFVGVRCSPEELERRERMRGDRPPGLAARQLERVHRHGLYDIECDTTAATPRECAEQINRQLADLKGPSAFERLRIAFGIGG